MRSRRQRGGQHTTRQTGRQVGLRTKTKQIKLQRERGLATQTGEMEVRVVG